MICPKCGAQNREASATCYKCGELLLIDVAPSGKFPLILLIVLELLSIMLGLVAINSSISEDVLYLSIIGIVLTPFLCWAIYAVRRSNLKAYNERQEQLARQAEARQAEMAAAAVKSEEDEDAAPDSCYKDVLALNDITRRDLDSTRRWVDGRLLPARPAYRQILRRRHTECENDDRISLSRFTEQLKSYAASCGVSLSEPEIFSLLSTMHATRLILLDTDPEAAVSFITMLSTFLNSNAHKTIAARDWGNTWDLMTLNPRTVGENRLHVTGVFCDLYFAHIHADNVCLTLLQETRAEDLKNQLVDLFPYFRDPAAKHELSMRHIPSNDTLFYFENDRFSLPSNIWFFCTAADMSAQEKQRMLDMGALTVQLALPELPESFSERSCIYPPIRVAHFLALMEAAVAERFLPEAVWCRVDALTKILEERYGLPIRNSDVLQLETLTSAYYSLNEGQDPLSALAYALSVRIMPRIWASGITDPTAAAELGDWMIKTFGEEIPACLRAPL